MGPLAAGRRDLAFLVGFSRNPSRRNPSPRSTSSTRASARRIENARVVIASETRIENAKRTAIVTDETKRIVNEIERMDLGGLWVFGTLIHKVTSKVARPLEHSRSVS